MLSYLIFIIKLNHSFGGQHKNCLQCFSPEKQELEQGARDHWALFLWIWGVNRV